MMLGTWSYFKAEGRVWTRSAFRLKCHPGPWTAKDSEFLKMSRDAFHAARGPRGAWPRGITFLAVHCEITELICADAAHAVRMPVIISKQNAETSHGINIAVDDCKTQGIEREKFRQITITATTDGGDRGPEDAA